MKKKLKELFRKRGRKSEMAEDAIKRSLRMQEELEKLTKNRKDVLVIERDELDFSKEEDLKMIDEKIKSKLGELNGNKYKY